MCWVWEMWGEVCRSVLGRKGVGKVWRGRGVASAPPVMSLALIWESAKR